MSETPAKRNWMSRMLHRPTTVPVVRLHGVIAAEQRQGRLNIASVGPLLDKAFGMKSAPAVAIVINSPGGSPVQSRLISKRIRDLADEHGKPVLVFVEDAAASGGYFIAVAGDEIFVDPSSIVGSIGVIMATFGFVGALDKLGIERRVHTAGRNKSTLDPFLPEKAEDVERIERFELEIHEVFIDHVKAGRRGRLKADDDTLFTGEWWTGLRSVDLGLVDAVGDLHAVMRERYGPDVVLKPIAPKRPFFGLPRLGFSAQGVVEDVTSSLEERVWWARLGL
ncbi:S49 family peptidase [Devosia sediminis]|uniref:S49 family peptidase n=1 Tax=Devosia sediminis TaxID=2798801 RepID=A0A934IXF0_9HYPH|nr:S49 family peptidase [Devosia sediminis]MBJ3784931.1 S49 family peptidase [Devosia sediminis]